MLRDKEMLGKRIKEAREIKSKTIGKRYTGQMLADDLGISRGYLGDLESGRTKPSEEILDKIIKICDLPEDFFDSKCEDGKLEQDFPEGVHVLRRASKELSPEAKKQMIKIMKTFLEEDDE